MCPHIQLQNFISDKEPLIEEESLIFVDYYDMPELIEDEEFYRDMPELIEDEEFYIDMPELIDGEYFYDRPELHVEELEAYISEYIAENEYVREDNQ